MTPTSAADRSPGSAASRLRPALVVLGCMACQMGAGWFYATRALSPDVIADLGWSRTVWSSGMAPMLLVSSIAQAFVGTACVRFGVRPVVVASVGLLAASVVALATMQGVAQFYLAMILLALGNAGIGDVSIGGVVTRWFERRRSLALGFAMVGTNLGAVAFIAAMAAVSGGTSWRTSALAVGLGGFAIILPFALFAVRDPRPGEGIEAELAEPAVRGEPAGAGDPADRRDPVAASEAMRSRESVELATAIRRPAFWILFYALFCYALVQLGLLDHLVLYLVDLGYSEDQAKGALGLTVGAGILSKLGAGIVTLRMRPKTAFVLNTGLLAASLALVPFADDVWRLQLCGFLFGIATSARDVLLPMAIADVFGARWFAQIYGVLMLAFLPGAVLGPIVLARIHDLTGGYRPGFVGGIGLVLVALVALTRLPTSGGRSARAAG